MGKDFARRAVNRKEVFHMPIIIRAARPSDGDALSVLYAPYARDTAITFEYGIPNGEDFARRIENTLSFYPFLVAEREGTLLGFVSASRFKDREAYDWAVETSIYVAREAHRAGLGRKLYEALEGALREMGVTNLNACIAYTGEPDPHLSNDSVYFHQKMGYRMVGRFSRCGYKFAHWYDMVWMEKMILPHTVPAEPVRPFDPEKFTPVLLEG